MTKDVDSALDDAIDKNVKAKLLQRRSNKDVRYVKNGVVTLNGSVNSSARRVRSRSWSGPLRTYDKL